MRKWYEELYHDSFSSDSLLPHRAGVGLITLQTCRRRTSIFLTEQQITTRDTEMAAEKDTGMEQVTGYSDWMSRLPAELHNTTLFDVAIPGSHDSMSYDLDTQSSIVEPDALKVFSNIYYVRKVLYNWAVTQEEPITKQLDAGVRYFDLRIARKPDDTDPTRLYFYHGLYTHTDVETILTAINGWAESHPKEILILALSHFKGFDKDGEQLHSHLINFIKTLFGAKLLQRFDIPTLKSSWDKGRNVIVSYDYPANQHPEIWCKIPYFYGNSMDPAQVESKICCVLEKPRPCGFFVCGLNLTLPEDAGALRYVLCSRGNFANVTERSLPEMVQWVKQYAGRRPNIVASDVVTRDDFVSTIVQLNYKGN
ncbi:PI-PLC X domain-containing protein 1-like [Solea senegalensis]|uniref:PI-PLC X domain-containing protein 1-like n=2 Tax=Solea senegalensis TaxID=28829 RepID=A0AAV6RQZ6_SOLSE|nr:PI-PLC X domain-containing protein 1-like [Solea senegalensis]